MSHIILVRHGQASLLELDYDKLCANGEAQAGLLGEYWSRRGVVFGSVYSGPRVRQLETARMVAGAYRSAGLSFPETVVMSEFDEYQAEAVLRECLPQLLQKNAEIKELRRAYEDSSEFGDRRKTFQKLFAAVQVFNDLLEGQPYRPVTPVGQLLWNQQRDRTEDALYHKMTPQAALDYGTRVVQHELDQ